MAMTFSSLLAAKGSSGSILNWVGYSKVDAPTILDETQSLIYSMLRVREMRTTWVFGMTVGSSRIALPDRFLDPLGQLQDITNSFRLTQKDQPVVESARTYETVSGTLGTNPFTTVTGQSMVTVDLTAHGLTQGSTFVPAGSALVGGLDLDGAFEIVEVTDADTFVISTGDSQATSTATGGGSAITFTANKLNSGAAGLWAIYDENVNFDLAFDADTNFRLPYFRSPALLSATNESNFLTNRYPKLLRVGTKAAAAEQMHDDQEYTKQYGALSQLIQSINVENDMFMRGGTFETDTPTPGDYY